MRKFENAEIKEEILRLMKSGIVMEEDNHVKSIQPDACKIGGKPFYLLILYGLRLQIKMTMLHVRCLFSVSLIFLN